MSINLEDAIRIENLDNEMFKRRENNMLLSDYQVSVLNRNGISYKNYSNYLGFINYLY